VTITVAALMQLRPESRDRTPPDADFGRAARLLAGDGIRVVVAGVEGLEFGGGGRVRVRGYVPANPRWIASGPHRLDAVFNRLPSRDPRRHAGTLAELAARAVPVGNPPRTNALALDKLRSGALLGAAGVPVPEIEGDPLRFEARIRRWGAGFLKPRFGSFGDGVVRVGPGEGAVGPEPDGGWILQRAVDPPPGPYAGICVRGFLQRGGDGGWRSAGRVARVSADDPVANVARGALGTTVGALQAEVPAARGIEDRLTPLEAAVAEALEADAGDEADRILEIGADWVLDPGGAPHLVEINGKPGGRLRILAELPGEEGELWVARHRAALAAPFRRLASLARAT